MLAQIPYFYRRARDLLTSPEDRRASASCGPTLGQFLAAGRYSAYFVRHFAVPLVSAARSSPIRNAKYSKSGPTAE
jgi:predicted NAD/FAD-binding protein